MSDDRYTRAERPAFPTTDAGIPAASDVLDRNPENFFAEIEQAAFSPANMVPGIGPSPDRMLLGRLFSYHDTHLHRVGTNYEQLPVNRPRGEVHTYNKDGAMRYTHGGHQAVYVPNSYGGAPPGTPRVLDTRVAARGRGVAARTGKQLGGEVRGETRGPAGFGGAVSANNSGHPGPPVGARTRLVYVNPWRGGY